MTTGAQVWHVLVPGVITLIAFAFSRELRATDSRSTTLSNLMLGGFLFSVLSLNAHIFARIAAYMETAAILLVPMYVDLVPSLFRPYAYVVIMLAYWVFCSTLLDAGQGGVLPYSFRGLDGSAVHVP